MSDSLPIKAQVIHRFASPAEAVFDAWITSNKVRQWFAPGLGEISRIAIDARVGGSFLFAQRRGMSDVEHIGSYKELERPTRLAFTWQVKGTPDSSLVSIDIAQVETGCELTLTHHMQPYWAHYRDRLEASWKKMLDAMAAALK
jgi:uncharacterized protein YndB with AHSA1/START domain